MNETHSHLTTSDSDSEVIAAEVVGTPSATVIDATIVESHAEPEVIDASTSLPAGSSCPSCSYPVEDSDHFCPACGTPNESFRSTQVDEPDESRHFQCKSCGSEITTDRKQRSYVCPFCDSTYVVEFSPDYSNKRRPEFVIGFGVTPEQAETHFRNWIKTNQWFRPGDLAEAKVAEKLQGIYLPFWSFSMLAQSEWKAEIGEHWYRTETYRTRGPKGKMVTRTRRVQETEWWDLAGRHHRYHHGYLVSASPRITQNDLRMILPFQLPALKRYEAFYLAGWLSEEYEIEETEALRLCKEEFNRREGNHIAAFLPGDSHRHLDYSTKFGPHQSDLILLPVYLMSYKYGDKLYRFMVNGQTGKVNGEKPYSKTKIGLLIGLIGFLIVLFIVVFLLFGLLGT